MIITSSSGPKCRVALSCLPGMLAALLVASSSGCGASGGGATAPSGGSDASSASDAGSPPSFDASESASTVQDSSVADRGAPPPNDAASALPPDAKTVADSNSDSDTDTDADSTASSGPFPFAPSFILGADISWASQHEAEGYTYSDGISVKPMEEIMANNGFNFIRLRTFVQPSASGGYAPGSAEQAGVPGYGTSTGGWCSTADTVAKVVRMKKCGLGVLVDFMMSDTWASIGGQTMPSSWVGLSQTVPATPVSASTHDNNI
jgi:hypothetical protein